MLNKAIGMVEYQTVSAGMTAADLMVKTANIEILQSSVVCPGKYITLISGDISAVAAAIEASKRQFGDKLSDSLTEKHKKDKVRNLLAALRTAEVIKTDSPNHQISNWVLNK